MRTVRRLAVSALVVLTLQPGVGEATATGTWTVTGKGTHSMALHVSAPLELAVEAAKLDISLGRRSKDSLVRIDGRYGGMLIRDAKGEVWAGLMRHVNAHALPSWGTYTASNRQILPRGRYTVTVFGDRTTRVYLPVVGGSSRLLTPTGPAKATFTDQQDPDQLRAALPAAAFSAPITVRAKTSFVVLGSLAGSVLTAPGIAHLCLGPASLPSCVTGDGGISIGPCVCSDSSQDTQMFVDPAFRLASGDYTARYTVAVPTVGKHHSLFTAVFD